MPAAGSGSGLRLVLGGAAAVSLLFGVLAYKRYADSEAWVAAGIQQMDQRGAGLDVTGCIDEVMSWYRECDQNDANAAVCEQAVKINMFHCLQATDRSEECQGYSSPPDDRGKWVFSRCEDRGQKCLSKRECACAEAFRAIDSFCRTGQEAVQL